MDPDQQPPRKRMDSSRSRHANGLLSVEKAGERPPSRASPSPPRSRIDHFTWAWYCSTMATGGMALLLSSQPYTFRGLMTIGIVVYIFNLTLFTCISAAIITRFSRRKGSLGHSLQHPTESLFFPTFWLSLATIISGMEKYGVPSTGVWLPVVIRVLFWAYVACTFLVAVLQYSYLFTARNHTINDMTPSWILPAFPIMLTGTLASVSAGHQPYWSALPIIVAGVSFQGLGMTVSILMYANYVRRLMQYGLPSPDVRPGMFIAVGPPSFTALAFIGIARAVPRDVSPFGDPAIAYEAINVVAAFNAVLLWSVSFWFFGISLVAVLAGVRQMSFHLTWWAMVFPNVGFAIATIEIGEVFQSDGVKGVGSGMTILLVVMYVFVFVHNVLALVRRRIVSEGRDEDA